MRLSARLRNLARAWDYLLSPRANRFQPRLGLEALEAREVPAAFAVRLLGESSDSGATHTSTVSLATGSYAPNGALLVSADTPAEAARAALTGQVAVTHFGQSATYAYSSVSFAADSSTHDQPFLLTQPDVGQPNRWRVGLEDLQASNMQELGVDWDYNDRVWDLDVREYQAPSTGTGTGLLARYFNAQDMTALGLIRVDPLVNNDWGTGSPASAIGTDHFSVRWSGQVEAQYTDDYVFKTLSDDGVRLWVDGHLVIDNWTDHGPTTDTGTTVSLVAGQKYDIVMEYFENGGGATAKLLWSSGFQPEEVIPTSQLYPDESPTATVGDGIGLIGEYFVGQNPDVGDPRITRLDPQVAYDWGGDSPDADIPSDGFSARWSGQVQPLYSGLYTFYTLSDDGVRLWVNGQELVDNWVAHGPTEDRGTITLVAGQKYDIVMEYYEGGGGATAQLMWSSDDQIKSLIGVSQLYPVGVAAVADRVETVSDMPLAIDVLGNDVAFGVDVSLLSFALTSGPAHGTVTLNDGGTPGDLGDDYFEYSPAAGYSGPDSFTYTLTAAEGYTSTATVSVSVTPARHLGLEGVEDRSDAEGDTVSLTVVASTATAPVTFTQSGLPAGLTIDAATGVISGAISYAAADTSDGLYTVTITATDGTYTESISFGWGVRDTNRIPFIDDQAHAAGATVTLPVASGASTGLTYSATGLPDGLVIDAQTGEISGTIDAATTGYTATVTVSATDGSSSDYRSFKWEVVVEPRVIFAVNGTLSADDDVATVAPGGDTLPVRVTLIAPGTSGPQSVEIRLLSDKSQLWYNGSLIPAGVLALQLADGESAEFDLVAVAWSEAKDDVELSAFLVATPNQPPAGGAKVTNVPPLFTDPVAGPNPERVNERAAQGDRADCWLIAAAISLAKQRPAVIKEMIKDNGNSTFTVTFPGDKKNPVTVKAKDIDWEKSGTSDGIWLAVLEAAYAELKNNSRAAIVKEFFPKGQEVNFMGFTKATIKTLTGHSVDADILLQGGNALIKNAQLRKKLGEKLDAALNPPAGQEKRVVTVMTSPTLRDTVLDRLKSQTTANPNGLFGTHWYAVYAYDATPGNERVYIRNPHGKGGEFGQTYEKGTITVKTTPDGDNDGLFWMSLKDFAESFAMVHFEESK